MSITSRQKDILSIIDGIDITPTMYINAEKKYLQLAQFLSDNGIEAEIYPQGSFALGTVVRPIMKGDDVAYDLDFVCQVRDQKNRLTPIELRDKVLNILKDSKLYEENLEEYEECFTISFADVDGVGFSIDIVPAVAESNDVIARLLAKSARKDLVVSAIAIPKEEKEQYSWITSNPIGYKTWFDGINGRFNEVSKLEYRQGLLDRNKHVFSSIQEIPEKLERSALQRVIQILKLHRDIYYGFKSDGDELKPISAIINTIVAEIAITASSYVNVFELLQYVLDEMSIYSEQQTLDEIHFASKYDNRKLVLKKGTSWVISNPANPEDNLADQWTDTTARVFFMWIKAAKKDLVDSLALSDERFRISIENAFGKSVVSRSWGSKYQGLTIAKTISDNAVAKPWKM